MAFVAKRFARLSFARQLIPAVIKFDVVADLDAEFPEIALEDRNVASCSRLGTSRLGQERRFLFAAGLYTISATEREAFHFAEEGEPSRFR